MPDDLNRLFTVSDLFDRTVRYIGRTVGRALAVGFMIMIPAGIVFGFTLRELFAGIGDMVHRVNAGSTDVSAVLPMIYALVEFGVGIVIFLAATLVALAAVIDLTNAAMHDTPTTWAHAFSRAWHAAPRLLSQSLVLLGIALAAALLPVMLLSYEMYGIGILAFLAWACLLVWIAIMWSMSGAAVICEDATALGGLARSAMIVKRRWWRTFGILLLFSIVTSFAVNLLMTPLQAFSFAGMIAKFQSLGDVASGDAAMGFDSLLPSLIDVSWAMGIIVALSEVLTVAVQGVYTTLVFHDLRVRATANGEGIAQ